MRSILKDQIRMVGDKRTNRAIGMWNPTLMMMRCKSQDGERKTYKKEIDKFSIHQPMTMRVVLERNGLWRTSPRVTSGKFVEPRGLTLRRSHYKASSPPPTSLLR